ncbi:hypothetical protein J2T17_004428 [Paenibacillus mucilaginosus]|uniref:DUF5983 family protein n=1 Tax=Paenibacillus mucilaginosus TaxID=61624 RepID=UPI003D1BE0DD
MNMLEISTFHIRPETSSYLDHCAEEADVLIVYPKSIYGWLVLVPEAASSESMSALPADLKHVVEFAQTQYCSWIMLDSDANQHPDLPTFKWE